MTSAYTLYHFPLCPFSRKVRMVLEEKNQPYNLVIEPYWERRPDFVSMNPAIEVPVLVNPHKQAIAEQNAICEYLEESYPSPNLLGDTSIERAEIRRLVAWFDHKFYDEVTGHIVKEKVMHSFLKNHQPHSEVIRAGKANINYHLDYIGYLLSQRKWLAGDSFSMADIAAAAQYSVLDYLGDVPWDSHPDARQWYALIKSRPSFRSFLHDRVNGFAPASHYANLDF